MTEPAIVDHGAARVPDVAVVGGGDSTNIAGGMTDFKEIKMLGEGAFSCVYKVQRLADKGIYALKKVKLPSLSDKEKENALNEIRLLASVHHENVISYKDAFFDDSTRCLCIITECADSGDLLHHINTAQKKRTHLKEADIWRYVIGLSNGLQALHAMRILHRDMKSANVFISSSKSGLVAKLGDFNVSTVAKRGLCMTQTGTPYYASPEVWRDMPYDGKSDMWSLGCVVYEACALKPPFRSKDMEGLYRRVLRGEYQRIPEHFSNELSDVIGAMLQVNPRYRPSAEQLLQLPVVQRQAAEVGISIAVASSESSTLLQTIKVPRKLADLSAYLPDHQYTDLDEAVAEVATKLNPDRRETKRDDATQDGAKGSKRRSPKTLASPKDSAVSKADDAEQESVCNDSHKKPSKKLHRQDDGKLKLPALPLERMPAAQAQQKLPALPMERMPAAQVQQAQKMPAPEQAKVDKDCQHRERGAKAGQRRRPGSRSSLSLPAIRKRREPEGVHGGGHARLPRIVSNPGRL